MSMPFIPERPDRLEFADQTFLRAIKEIEADITSGVLPEWIGDFDDFVHLIDNRNSYGGLYTEETRSNWRQLYGDETQYPEFGIQHRLRVHLWLKNRHNAIPGARFRDDWHELLDQHKEAGRDSTEMKGDS
jgi:hypothetical protein